MSSGTGIRLSGLRFLDLCNDINSTWSVLILHPTAPHRLIFSSLACIIHRIDSHIFLHHLFIRYMSLFSLSLLSLPLPLFPFMRHFASSSLSLTFACLCFLLHTPTSHSLISSSLHFAINVLWAHHLTSSSSHHFFSPVPTHVFYTFLSHSFLPLYLSSYYSISLFRFFMTCSSFQSYSPSPL